MKKKHLKSKIGQRMRVLSAAIVGLFMFMIFANVHPIVGVLAFLTSITLPFVWKESDVLATGGVGGEQSEVEKAAALLMEKVKEHLAQAKFMSSDEFQKKYDLLIEEFVKKNGLDKLPAALETLADVAKKVNALGEKATDSKPQTFKSVIFKALDEKKEQLSNLKGGGNGVQIELKAAGTITTSNVDAVGTDGISILLTDVQPGIERLPRAQPFFMQLFSWRKTSKSEIAYAEQKNPDGGAGMTAEGAAKTQADFDIVEAKASVKKVTSYIKASKESLDDISELSSLINDELKSNVLRKADGGVMDGDGTGDNLNGIITIAQAFTGGALAGTIPTPNNFDVLVAAITEIMVAEVQSGVPAGFMPNVIVMNPVDVAAMRLTKSSTGEYVFPVTLPGTTSVLELPVVSNAYMTAGDFLVMDSSKVNAYIREGVNIQIGYVNDDFTKNLVTILAEMRLTVFVKSNHVKAFITGDFESAKGLLETV